MAIERSTSLLNVFPWTGGLNKTLKQVQLSPNELTEANNIVYSLNGSRKKRPGITNYVTDIGKNMGDGPNDFVMGFDYMGDGITESTNLRGLYQYWRSVNNTQTPKMIAFINGKLFADNDEVRGIFRDITGSTIINATDRITFDVFVGALIMCFKSTTPKLWTMTGDITELGVDVPNGSLYRTHLGSGWIAGVANNQHVVYKSDTGNPLAWTGLTADAFDLDVGDGDPIGITALFPSFYGDLYVAKYNSIYRIRPSGTTFSVNQISRSVGCANHNTAIAINNDIIFVSSYGVHSISTVQEYGDSKYTFLSEPIHEYFRDVVDMTRADNMWAVYCSEYNSYLLAYTRKGDYYNKYILGLDLTGMRWFEWQNVDCAAIATFFDVNKNRNIMLGGHTGNIGYLDKNTYLDFGTTPVSSTIKTGVIYPFKSPTMDSKYCSVYIHYVPKGDWNFQLSCRIDDKQTQSFNIQNDMGAGDLLDSTFILDSSILDGVGTFKTYRQEINGFGRGIELTISDSPSGTEDHDLEILGYEVEVESAGNTNRQLII